MNSKECMDSSLRLVATGCISLFDKIQIRLVSPFLCLYKVQLNYKYILASFNNFTEKLEKQIIATILL